MNLVTIVAVLVSALCVVLAQDDGRYRPPTTARPLTTRYRPYRPYDPFNQYRNVNQGRYVARNDGRYSGANDGRYVPRNDGRYVHVEGPSGAGAGKYSHVEGPSGAGAGKYSHVEGPSGSGSGGQGAGAGAGSGADSGAAATAAPAAPPTPAFVPTTPVPVLAQRAQVRTAPPKPYDADGWKIIRLEHNVKKDGYQYIFETQNGINAEESGRIEPDGNGSEGLRSTGYYEYVGDDGQLYRVDYVADSNGFIPQGDHIPKVPPAIEKLLAYLASQPK